MSKPWELTNDEILEAKYPKAGTPRPHGTNLDEFVARAAQGKLMAYLEEECKNRAHRPLFGGRQLRRVCGYCNEEIREGLGL